MGSLHHPQFRVNRAASMRRPPRLEQATLLLSAWPLLVKDAVLLCTA